MTEIDWLGVRQRVGAITSMEAARTVFGAIGHKFVLHPVLTVAELADLEQGIGVRLPAEYRSFLLEVGNGGAGPGYGLERVEWAIDGWRWMGDGVTTVGRLGIPFQPFDPRVYDEHAAQRPVERDFSDPDAFTQAGLAWVQRLDDLYDEETFGTVALSHQGCGYFWLLVVSGPERGTVWDDSRAADIALSPLTGPAGGRLTFGQWYLDWLAQAEAAVAAADKP